jgi:galactose-1-phosphate uridylyltransferase
MATDGGQEGRQELTRARAEPIIQSTDIGSLSYREIAHLFRAEGDIYAYAPSGISEVDPRDRGRVLYSAARAHRPHDRLPEGIEADGGERTPGTCAICRGETTGIVDLHDLSDGFTFINKNLYPMLLPPDDGEILPEITPKDPLPDAAGLPAKGLHFLQWTSSVHGNDWHNMPLGDLARVMQRLSILERQLLTTNNVMPPTWGWDGREGISGFVSIVKNGGRQAGGSITHGHQQIAFSNIMPRSTYEHWAFAQSREEPFSAYLLRQNPTRLNIRDYDLVVLLVPYFMRRPYEMMVLLKDTRKRYLFELDSDEISAISAGWHDAIVCLHRTMPSIGRQVAYNVITHNGPGAGLYFSILPHTQEMGGFEHLGLSISQATPQQAADSLRSQLG